MKKPTREIIANPSKTYAIQPPKNSAVPCPNAKRIIAKSGMQLGTTIAKRNTSVPILLKFFVNFISNLKLYGDRT